MPTDQKNTVGKGRALEFNPIVIDAVEKALILASPTSTSDEIQTLRGLCGQPRLRNEIITTLQEKAVENDPLGLKAAEILGLIGTPSTIEALFKALKQNPVLAAYLPTTDTPQLRSELLNCLASTFNFTVFRQVAERLGELKEEKAKLLLLQLFRDQTLRPSEEFRRTTALVLAEFGDSEVAPALMSILRAVDQKKLIDPYYNRMVILQKILRLLPQLGFEDAAKVSTLLEFYLHPHQPDQTRLDTIEALKAVQPGTIGVDLLIKLLENEAENQEIKLAVMDTLATIADPATLEALYKLRTRPAYCSVVDRDEDYYCRTLDSTIKALEERKNVS